MYIPHAEEKEKENANAKLQSHQLKEVKKRENGLKKKKGGQTGGIGEEFTVDRRLVPFRKKYKIILKAEKKRAARNGNKRVKRASRKGMKGKDVNPGKVWEKTLKGGEQEWVKGGGLTSGSSDLYAVTLNWIVLISNSTI